MKTIRELVRFLLGACGDIDSPVNVRILRRDTDNVVIAAAIVHVRRVDSHDNICIEESEIYFAKEP